SRQVHVFVRRVIRRRLAGDRPVARGVHIAHVDRQRSQRTRATAQRIAGEQTFDDGALGALPGEARTYIYRLDFLVALAPRLIGEQHRAVEASREQYSRGHIIDIVCIQSPSASISATATACSTTTASANILTVTTRRSRSKFVRGRLIIATWSVISA